VTPTRVLTRSGVIAIAILGPVLPSTSSATHQPYYVNARSYGQAIVSIEAILLMHGFDRRVE
jgi:hypothetical protein